jgi:hypothetical protein
VRVCGAKLQPEDALSLPEPVERLAGDPVVAAPLPIPADWFGAERSRSAIARHSRMLPTKSPTANDHAGLRISMY